MNRSLGVLKVFIIFETVTHYNRLNRYILLLHKAASQPTRQITKS